MASLYMETTSVPAEKTAQEVCFVLVRAGATNINQQYENQKLIGLRWTMKIRGNEVLFEMPARVDPLYNIMEKRVSPRTAWKVDRAKLRNQAERVAWRQLLRWVQAQLAMIETGMVEPGEVFAPYISLAHGTLYQCLVEGKIKGLLAAGGGQ